jgi:uncharacterized protein YndB with AHSA1/START domain
MKTATLTETAVAHHELKMTRVFDAPRELVWKAWTDAEQAREWGGPRGFVAMDVKHDVRPGGKWSARLHSDGFDTGDGVLRELDLWQGGEYREVVEPERLVFTFHWDAASGLGDHDTVITITLEEQDGKTRMNFHQAFFVREEDRDGHMRGWGSSFDRLDDYLHEVKAKETKHG